jgi:TPP-dependent 2-oxoacid decarboxylase
MALRGCGVQRRVLRRGPAAAYGTDMVRERNARRHPQFAGVYAGAVSEPNTRQIVEGADIVLDLGGVNLNDITTAAYSGHLDLSRFITVGLDDVTIGDEVIANVRLADVPSWPSSNDHRRHTGENRMGSRR